MRDERFAGPSGKVRDLTDLIVSRVRLDLEAVGDRAVLAVLLEQRQRNELLADAAQ